MVAPGWVGDLVMAQTLFKYLKQQQPNCMIDLLAAAWARPLIERMPEINRHHVADFKHGQLRLRARFHLAKQLRAYHYNHAIILPNSFKSALIPWWAKIKQRTGWRGEQRWGVINDLRLLNKKRLHLMIQRYLALGEVKHQAPSPVTEQDCSAWWPSLSTSVHQQQQRLADFNLNLEQPVLALCPGAKFGPAKQWPSQHFASLAQQMSRKGWQIWLLGSREDMDTASKIQQACTPDVNCMNLCGQTRLDEAIDLLATANVVVSNDSGLMHIAAALKRPVVALYGATTPDFAPPLCDHKVILSQNLSCQPCFKRHCPLKHFNCMNNLAPQTVVHAIEQLKVAAP